MEESHPSVPVEALSAGYLREPRLRFFRLVSFWLGLPVLVFLLWAWQDSMRHALVLNWKHGSPVRMVWPPVEKAAAIALPKIPEPEPVRLANAPGLSGEPSPISRWDPLGEVHAFDLTSLPQERSLPFSPYYPPPLRRISDEVRPVSVPTKVQPYGSLGSKAGSLWISSWVSPDWRPLPVWKYEREAATTGWLPALDWGHSAISRSSTVWIPYWLITLAYLICWGTLQSWRIHLLRKRRERMGTAAPEVAF
jgi:hypothetical protein